VRPVQCGRSGAVVREDLTSEPRRPRRRAGPARPPPSAARDRA